VAGVDLSVATGTCLALFGPNGAGKSTLLRLLAGLLRPSAGSMTLLGQPLTGDGAQRGRVGLLSHQSMLYDVLTVAENLRFAAELQGVDNPGAAVARIMERLELTPRASSPVRALSRGWQQRVAIARALVHAPALLLLDEPYTGLDVAGARALTTLLRAERDAGTAMVLVTHDVTEGLALATHAAILLDGRIARHDDAATLSSAAYADAYRALATGQAA
jgi:heme exporter protein A